MAEEEANITLEVEETDTNAEAEAQAQAEAEAKAEADAKAAADAEEATKKAAEEEAARVAAEEEAAKKAAEEEAAKKAAEEEAARVAEEEEARVAEEEEAEQQAELARLNAQTNALWKEGQMSNWESMSHTEMGVRRHNIQRTAQVHRGFMTNMTRKSQHSISSRPVQHKQVSKPQTQVKPTNTRQTLQKQGGMFGLRR